MAWFLSNIRYVAWTALAVAALFLIYFAMGVAGYAFDDQASGKRRCAGATCWSPSCGSGTSIISTSRKSPTCRKFRKSTRPADRQGDRAGGALLVSLGRDADADHRRAAGVEPRLSAAGADAGRRRRSKLRRAEAHLHRHWHVARHHHVVQCLVHHLAEPAEGAEHRQQAIPTSTRRPKLRRARRRCCSRAPTHSSPCRCWWR